MTAFETFRAIYLMVLNWVMVAGITGAVMGTVLGYAVPLNVPLT